MFIRLNRVLECDRMRKMRSNAYNRSVNKSLYTEDFMIGKVWNVLDDNLSLIWRRQTIIKLDKIKMKPLSAFTRIDT